ncbi:hypothetical protein [Sphingosinicella sp. BN140058]|uniref:hypothetical protein n=1 Tax=Sphingosinicella sp. BN140058 TaxID=1892855 RepID=UPI001010FC52|nr:hypothetical protein [Sphingosinicella sp. BN140058]QAY79053.1 hypothetical protein ETR14_22810 [Sphingosinicella sp. BN140058]
MDVAWLLMLQTAAASSAPVPSDFDLAKIRAADTDLSITGRCAASNAAEIVVCGRRRSPDADRDRYRPEFAEKPLRAEIGIGGGATARAFVDSVAMPNGEVSKRVMVGVKLPF